MLIPFGVFSAAGAGGGAAAGAYELISTTTLASTATSVSFSSIVGTYKHLQVRMVVKEASDTNTNIGIRFNSDTGSNYNAHVLQGNGSAVSSYSWGTGTYAYSGNGAQLDSGIFAPAIIDVLDYSSSSKNTTLRTLTGRFGDSTNPTSFIHLISGLWRNTAAVTDLSVIATAGSWGVGSRFSLYGIKG